VLDAARTAFAAHGYEKTSTRAIARAAGVDVAQLHH
jgi:AcrR family transcriptional regulator